MRNFKKTLLLILTIALLLSAVACGQASTAPEKTQETETTRETAATQESVSPQEASPTREPTAALEPVALTISAASSLKDAMEEIKEAYIKENPNVTITYNFDSSGSLQQQIEQGAEVDVFISAAEKQMDALKDKGLIIDETRKDFLENKIVLVVPEDSTGIHDFADLATDKVKKIGLGEPKSVPVGQYAEELLTKLNLLDSIKSQEKVVYGKNVKEVLTWVETGNADAGIVYETDALVSDKVKVAARAPDGLIKPVYYPAAVIGASKHTDAAKAFTSFLYSASAKPVFEKYGFLFLLK